jgi:hypothetical protein
MKINDPFNSSMPPYFKTREILTTQACTQGNSFVLTDFMTVYGDSTMFDIQNTRRSQYRSPHLTLPPS